MGAPMRLNPFRRSLAALSAALVLFGCLTGCRSKPQPVQTTIFAMDTVMNLTVYGTDKDACQTALNDAVGEIYALERLLSVTDGDSFVYALNHAGGEWVEADPPVPALLEDTLALCEATGGALDVTAYPAVRAWGFTTGEYRVPGQDELAALAAAIDYTQVEQGDGAVRLPQDMELDLGSVTKGYTGDVLAGLLAEAGISSALLDLGQSSIQAVGAKPDGSPWRVGIQDPAGEDYLGVLEIADQAMGTSGGYQRYFEADGVRYWHIIDPATAAPARSGLASVTVVSTSGLLCDGLSTALFVMGLEEGAAFWHAHPELAFDAIFISDDGSIAVTAGLEEAFSLAEGYEGREVTVLQ